MIAENNKEKADYEHFKEKVSRAKKLGLITELQKKALLLKKSNQQLPASERIALNVQNRNALRILRNTITNNPPLRTKEIIIQILRVPVIQELIGEVDQEGILCHQCQKGIVIETTTSSWLSKENYTLILEHLPAKICTNHICRETIFSSKTMKAEANIVAKIEECLIQVKEVAFEKSQTIERQCPVCEQAVLTWNATITCKYSVPNLFHLKINEIPVKAKCPICSYSEAHPKIESLLKNLLGQLKQDSLELITG
ncbi:MAG: hypothetical protein JXA54_03790 [Candidatus Heimdallarchaeota archaeon]|nr:hypothetical protein [Candidatus Heimdallarchaeota archaeon]